MLSAEQVKSFSIEKRLELVKSLVGQKIEKILCKAIELSVVKYKKEVRVIIDDDKPSLDPELIKGFLIAHGYEKIEVKCGSGEDCAWVDVRFEIPE